MSRVGLRGPVVPWQTCPSCRGDVVTGLDGLGTGDKREHFLRSLCDYHRGAFEQLEVSQAYWEQQLAEARSSGKPDSPGSASSGRPSYREIVDRCPSCGAQALFIGSGGYLTCGVIGCKEPGVGAAIEAMQGELRLLRSQERRWYRADSSFVELEDAQAVRERRKDAARLLLKLRQMVQDFRSMGATPDEAAARGSTWKSLAARADRLLVDSAEIYEALR